MTAPARRFRTLAILLTLTFGAKSAPAQTSATVTGTIVDPSGGVLPGVSLTLRNVATGLVRTTVTSPEGRFVFAGLPASSYELTAELSGFRRLVQQNVAVTVGETMSLSLSMAVGGVEQTVTVTGGAPLVNTATPELSFLVGERAIESLPLNGRNYVDLALLQPGVLATPRATAARSSPMGWV
jgi:hypothetical protein